MGPNRELLEDLSQNKYVKDMFDQASVLINGEDHNMMFFLPVTELDLSKVSSIEYVVFDPNTKKSFNQEVNFLNVSKDKEISTLLGQICAQKYIYENEREPSDEVIAVSKNMSVMSRHTAMIARLKLNQEQVKAIQGKEA